MKETLEEFIEREGYSKGITQEIWEDGVRLGAKWQQEQMYSEEEVENIIRQVFNDAAMAGQDKWIKENLKKK
jgi:hypothetical protein